MALAEERMPAYSSDEMVSNDDVAHKAWASKKHQTNNITHILMYACVILSIIRLMEVTRRHLWALMCPNVQRDQSLK